MRIRLRLFGSVREALGAGERAIELPDGARVAQLRELLASEHPIFRELGDRVAASVNYEIVSDAHVLRDGDEVAFLPPVAGGSGAEIADCWLSQAPLDVAAVVARVSAPERGGVVTFLGAVRDHARGQSIERLEYEAYPGMAEREMQKIAAEAAARWPGVRVAIAHRVGRLAIGDLAVVIAAAAPHRGEAFEACRFAIDTLKRTVPIWKKEFAVGGAYWVDDRP